MNNKSNQKEEQRKAVIPMDRKEAAKHVVYIVNDDTLSEFGVNDGDLLIVKVTDVINENKITLWETPDGIVAKFAYDNFGDIVLFTDLNDQKTYKAKKVKMLGVLVYTQKRAKEFQHFNSESEVSK